MSNVKKMLKSIRVIVVFSIVLLVICGMLYPLAMTGIAQVLFPSQANGSLIYVDGEAVGSKLIGQDFTDPRFMKCRPSAVSYNTYTQEQLDDGTYGGVATGSKNYAPSNPDLVARVEADIEKFLEENPTVKRGEIPADLLTASGSGLDPHLSPASAKLQVPALSETTGISEEELGKIVENNTKGKTLGIFGAETVNVLSVNLEIAKVLGIIAE